MQLLRLCALLRVTFAATKNESDDPLISKYPGLLSWFTSNGGKVDDRIKIGYDAMGIRGMIATDMIPKDTVIIDCPGDLVVKPKHRSIDPCLPIEHIAEQLQMGEKSKWHDYFDFDDSLGSRLPSDWNEGMRAFDELQGLPPAGEIHRHINWYTTFCKKDQEPNEIELRAFKIFLTRAADIGLIPMYGKFPYHLFQLSIPCC